MLSSKEAKDPSGTLEAMLSVFLAVLDARGAVYCSAPITSGRRHLAWLQGVGKTLADIDYADDNLRHQHETQVVLPNSSHAQAVVARIRSMSDLPIIDPTSLPPRREWTQSHWRYFWTEVIRMYVSKAIFLDHWEYSNGCALEFFVAKRKGIPTETESGQRITLEMGVEMVKYAIEEIRQQGGSTTFLASVWQDLSQLPRTPGE